MRSLPIVQQMPDRQYRMPQQHFRSGVSHDFADFVPLFGRIAVDRTRPAGRFIFAEPAAGEPLQRVSVQLRAFRAQAGFASGGGFVPAGPFPAAMPAPAIKGNHQGHCRLLAADPRPFFFRLHPFNLQYSALPFASVPGANTFRHPSQIAMISNNA